MAQRIDFLGHARAVDIDTRRYVPAGDVTGRLVPLFIFPPPSDSEYSPAKPMERHSFVAAA
jgi:hypothetical protein